MSLIYLVLTLMFVGEMIFAGLCISCYKNLKDSANRMHEYTNLIIDLHYSYQKENREWQQLVQKYNEGMAACNNLTNLIQQQYDTMMKLYKDSSRELLDEYKNIQERYSDGYEAFQHNSCLITEMLAKLDEITLNGQNLELIFNPPEQYTPFSERASSSIYTLENPDERTDGKAEPADY